MDIYFQSPGMPLQPKQSNPLNLTLIERKSRLPQIQGVQGRSRSKLLRALGNAGAVGA
jgi:hypothetical protein